MSIRLMQSVLDSKAETPGEKLVLLVIANYADDEGNNIYPSKQTLADRTGLDARTVQRICAKLIERGVLVVVHESLRRPTVYQLRVDMLESLENYRRAAGRPPKAADNLPAPVQKSTGPSAESTGVTPPNPSENHQLEPSDTNGNAREDVAEEEPEPEPADTGACLVVVDPLAETAAVVPSWAADWPILHVEGGDFEIKEPYASHPEIREGMIEWINRRHANKDLKRKGKCMPTVFGMQRSTCGWWDKYPLEAVAHAVTRAASEGWQGIIEDIARTWKPEPGSAASVKSSVQHRVQNMRDTMEKRQQMIREAASRAAVLTSPQNQLPAREVEQDGRA